MAAAGGSSDCLADADWVFLGGADGTELLERFIYEDLGRVLTADGFAVVCVGCGMAVATVEDVVERASCGAFVACVADKTDDEQTTIYRIERSAASGRQL